MPRKKNPDDEFLTRGVFKKELKEELKVALTTFGKELRQEMRLETRQLLIDFYHSLVEPRFLRLESEVGGLRGEFDEFRHESLGRFDDLYKKFEDLNQEYVFTNHQLKGIDLRMDRLESKVDGLESKVDSLETKVDSLETKVDGLERKVDIIEVRLPYPS